MLVTRRRRLRNAPAPGIYSQLQVASAAGPAPIGAGETAASLSGIRARVGGRRMRSPPGRQWAQGRPRPGPARGRRLSSGPRLSRPSNPSLRATQGNRSAAECWLDRTQVTGSGLRSESGPACGPAVTVTRLSAGGCTGVSACISSLASQLVSPRARLPLA